MPGFFHLGVAKSPKPTKTLWLGFLSSWLALPRILFPSSKWLDRPRTNLWLTLNSQCTISKSEQTPRKSEKKREKTLFSRLRSQFRAKPMSDSRRGCMWLWLWPWRGSRVEPCAVAARQDFSLSQSRRRSHGWTPLWPRSSLFPGIESSSGRGSLP